MNKEELEKLTDTFIDKVPSLTKDSSPEEKQKVLDEINYILQVDPMNLKALEWKVLYYSAIEDYDNVLLAHKEFLKAAPDNTELDDLVEICKEFLENVKNIIKGINEENKNKLITWIYKIRYYRYIPISETESVRDLQELNNLFEEVIRLIIKKLVISIKLLLNWLKVKVRLLK